MCELRVHGAGELFPQRDDPLGCRLQLPQVRVRIAFVGGAVGDDGQSLAQGVGQLAVDRRIGSS